MTLKFPSGWVSSEAPKKLVKEREVVAKGQVDQHGIEVLDMGPEVAGAGLCPACGIKLSLSRANGHFVLFCPTDRIVLPIKDEILEELKAGTSPLLEVNQPQGQLGQFGKLGQGLANSFDSGSALRDALSQVQVDMR